MSACIIIVRTYICLLEAYKWEHLKFVFNTAVKHSIRNAGTPLMMETTLMRLQIFQTKKCQQKIS